MQPGISSGEFLKPAVSEIPVFVLCGGLGTRFREETETLPKPTAMNM